jgi:hypothetical protein
MKLVSEEYDRVEEFTTKINDTEDLALALDYILDVIDGITENKDIDRNYALGMLHSYIAIVRSQLPRDPVTIKISKTE